MVNYRDLFDRANKLVGTIGGDYFNVYSPDYSVADNTPVLVAEGVKFRCDPVGYKFAEPLYQGAQYYDIFGPKSLIQTGDILIKSTPDGMTPAITVSTIFPMKAVTGFRSNRICKIMNSVKEADGTDSEPIYENVYFEFLAQMYPGTAINRAFEDSLKIPNTKAVLYPRENIVRQRMHLVETDIDYESTLPDGSLRRYERKWLIDTIEWSGPMMILTLKGA